VHPGLLSKLFFCRFDPTPLTVGQSSSPYFSPLHLLEKRVTGRITYSRAITRPRTIVQYSAFSEQLRSTQLTSFPLVASWTTYYSRCRNHPTTNALGSWPYHQQRTAQSCIALKSSSSCCEILETTQNPPTAKKKKQKSGQEHSFLCAKQFTALKLKHAVSRPPTLYFESCLRHRSHSGVSLGCGNNTL
jgi:hypothetical protein